MNLTIVLATLTAASLTTGACSVGVVSYVDFQTSVWSGASCNELFDQRANFNDQATLDKIDKDLADIGCDGRDSERADR